MSTTQNLKFIHLSTESALTHKADAGAIIFEKASGRIAVANGTDNVEYYGGGRVSNAEFDTEHKILTISFNDTAETIKLDFSDTASAEGVNKILGALRTDVNALKTSVGTSSDAASETGSVYARIAKNKEDIAANTTAIQANTAAIADINNESTGILAKAKKYTDDEIVELRGGADGYTGTLMDLDGRITSNDTDITALQNLHANKTGESGKMKVIDEINAKVGEIKINDKAVTVKEYVDTEVGKVNTAAETLGGRVTALETTVNNAETGLVKKVDDLSKLHADKDDKTGKKTVAEEVTAGVNAKVGDIKIDGAAVTVKAYVDGKDEAVREYVAGEVLKINGTTTGLDTRIGALETTVNDKSTGLVKKVADNTDKLTTLIGSDVGKSARTIANEELAAQLIPENAKDSLDTLKEIAAWIQTHPDDASAMNDKIKALEGKVGEPAKGEVAATGLHLAVANNATAIAALQGLHDGGKKVADEVKAGIAGIVEHSETNDDKEIKTADVVVTVTTAAGSVSGVAVDASVLRNDLGESNAEAGTGTAFARIKTLETTVGDSNSGLVKAVAGNTTAISNNAAAIKVLQDAQASGSLMWSVWD